MADQMPILDPAELIGASAAALVERLTKAAHAFVKDALDQGSPSVAAVQAALETITAGLPSALKSELDAQLPQIAAQAVLAAEVEIAPAREASGKPFQPVDLPNPPDAVPWLATAAAALAGSIRIRIGLPSEVTATTSFSVNPEELSAKVLAELDDDIRKAIDQLVETMTARTVNESRLATFLSNEDIVKRLQYTAVVDEKTSAGCRHLAGVDFNLRAKNIPRPPLHPGCRSSLKPITGIRRKPGATDAEISRQNWAIYQRLEREAKAKETKAMMNEGRTDGEVLEFRFSPAPDGDGVFSGYAIVWDVLDGHKTMFAPGSLRIDSPIPLLWSHNPEKPVGAVLEARADAKGLFIRGKISVGTNDGKEAYALVKDRAITGLSIGFRRLSDVAVSGGRRITSASLREISLVTFPSNESARILEVRCAHAAPDAAQSKGGQMEHTDTPASESVANETRAAVDSVAAKIDTLTSAMESATRRMDRLEARSLRLPLAGSVTDTDASVERRSFENYLRGGTAGMEFTEVRSLRTGDDISAGYLAPAEFIAEVDKNIVLWSPVRQLATVRNTARGSVELPKRIGRPTATWVEELEDRDDTETGSRYGKSAYEVKELTAYVDVAFSTLEDAAVDIFAELAADLAEEFGQAEGEAFVTGNGVKRPMGFMSDTSIPTVASGDAAKITADSLIDAFHALPSPYRTNAVWAMNSTTLGAVRKLKTSTGEYLLSMTGLAGSPVTTILGRPVVELPDMPDITAGAIPLVFGDFAQGYRVFDRVGFSLLRDDLTQRTKGKCRFHARKRVAGGVRKSEALRKLRIATN